MANQEREILEKVAKLEKRILELNTLRNKGEEIDKYEMAGLQGEIQQLNDERIFIAGMLGNKV